MARILVATSDTKLYDTLDAELSGDGHEVVWGAEGNEAYQLALSAPPDLVFLDQHLSVFDGFEVCGLLRGDPEVPRELPVILLSDEEIDPHRLEKVRATCRFPKTHLVQELRDLIAKYLRNP